MDDTEGTTSERVHSSSHTSPSVCVWVSREAQSVGRLPNDTLCTGTSFGTAYSTILLILTRFSNAVSEGTVEQYITERPAVFQRPLFASP